MKRNFSLVALSLVLSVALSTMAFSQAKPDVLVKQRQAAMTLMGKYFGPLGGMAQNKVPFSADTVARNAAYVEALSKMPWDGFQSSTANEKSRALPSVFSDTSAFKKAADDLQGAVSRLAIISKGGDETATKAAIGAVGKTCGGCHDKFRQEI
jgi:cytochrome c556